MPILLQLAQSYSNPDSVNYKLAYLREQMEQQFLNLGDLAYEDQVQLAMLGETIIVGGYLRTELIAANSIVGDKIASNAIVTRHIQADAITADKIAANSITTDKIDSNSITADKIASNAIVTRHIQAGAITANKLDVQTLSAISANLGTITAGNITGVTITGGTLRTDSGNNRIELSNNLLRSYSGGVRRVQLDYNSLDFYNSDGSKGGEIIGVYSDIWELPVLMLRSDTGVVETESRISSNNYARIEVVAGHPNIDSPAHVAIEVYQPSVGGLGGMEIGPGGVMTSGFMYVEGDFEVYGQKSAVVETENYGMRKLYAIESPENRFVDIIKVDDLEGKQWVKMNPMFAETISEYEVFHNGDVEILEKQQGKFLVDGSGKVLFLIYGKRKGYEDVYMEKAGCGFEQYHLSRLKRGVINETTSDSGHEQGNSDTETSDRGTHTDKCNSSGED